MLSASAASAQTPAAGAAPPAPPAETPPVRAPADPAPPVPGTTTFLAETLLRVEFWRYFQPRDGGAAGPDYTFGGSRSSLGVSYVGPRWSAQGTLQYVRLENLPAHAIGPGLLGTGAAYYFQAAGTFSYQFYLRGLSLAWRDPEAGTWVEAGRLSRAARVEPPSGDATIDGLLRDELNGRLLGDMEWSYYQRAWDGVRGGIARQGRSATLTVAAPTQGTYEESANLYMDHVPVAALEFAAQPGAVVRRTRLDAFAIRYADTRPVTARPDNTARQEDRVSVRITTLGASAAGAYPRGGGTVDVVVWGAVQGGRWYEQSHRARAATASAGYRRTAAPWRPRARAGIVWASGDADPRDDRHATFFPMLPSGDRLSAINAYALMNVRDAWLAVDVAPSPRLDVAGGLRRVHLSQGADRWYQGSGATVRAGNYFGFQGRDGGGATAVGTVMEARAEWRPWRAVTVRGYVGRMAAGDVAAHVFAGRRLVTGWLESAVRF